MSDVDRLEEDNGLKRVFKKFEGKLSSLKNRRVHQKELGDSKQPIAMFCEAWV